MLLSRFTAHIRLEELAVFPLVEESLSEAALTELAVRLEVKEEGPCAELWLALGLSCLRSCAARSAYESFGSALT
jgi:hypothetical protein